MGSIIFIFMNCLGSARPARLPAQALQTARVTNSALTAACLARLPSRRFRSTQLRRDRTLIQALLSSESTVFFDSKELFVPRFVQEFDQHFPGCLLAELEDLVRLHLTVIRSLIVWKPSGMRTGRSGLDATLSRDVEFSSGRRISAARSPMTT